MEQEIKRFIINQNPWWQGKYSFAQLPKFKRQIYSQVLKQLSNKLMLSISGLRRVGKTVLMRQLIKYLLEEKKTNPQNILFFSFDEVLLTKDKDVLQNVIESFLKTFSHNHNKTEKLYFFLDELQHVSDWQVILKRFYDQNNKIKFVVSGSSSLYVRHKSLESLAGRIIDIQMYPLAFNEFLDLQGSQIKAIKTSPFITANKINKFQKGSLDTAIYDDHFIGYLLYGQFPELLSLAAEWQTRGVYIKSILDKVLEIDIPKTFGIDKIDSLTSLAQIYLTESGALANYELLAGQVGLTRQIVKSYTSFLNKAFIINCLENFYPGKRIRQRKLKKIYATSTNFWAVANGVLKRGQLEARFLGVLAETLAVQILSKYGEVFFWRRRQKEVDVIIKRQNEIFPFEVKFRQKVSIKDADNLLAFMEKYKIKEGVILTRFDLDVWKLKDKTVKLIPLSIIN